MTPTGTTAPHPDQKHRRGHKGEVPAPSQEPPAPMLSHSQDGWPGQALGEEAPRPGQTPRCCRMVPSPAPAAPLPVKLGEEAVGLFGVCRQREGKPCMGKPPNPPQLSGQDWPGLLLLLTPPFLRGGGEGQDSQQPSEAAMPPS